MLLSSSIKAQSSFTIFNVVKSRYSLMLSLNKSNRFCSIKVATQLKKDTILVCSDALGIMFRFAAPTKLWRIPLIHFLVNRLRMSSIILCVMSL